MVVPWELAWGGLAFNARPEGRIRAGEDLSSRGTPLPLFFRTASSLPGVNAWARENVGNGRAPTVLTRRAGGFTMIYRRGLSTTTANGGKVSVIEAGRP